MSRTRRGALVVPIALAAGVVRAQDAATEVDVCATVALVPEPGIRGTETELRARCEAERRHRYIRARELADEALRANPSSYQAHYVLGYVYHYGEGNYPRALFHLRRAETAYVQAHGATPGESSPWRWHRSIQRELIWTLGSLERYEEQLAAIDQYNRNYTPPMLAEAAWPWMKLRRFDEARAAAAAGEATGDEFQREVALNARCAIEYEAGDESRSYVACREALDLHGRDPESQSAVDFTNYAEAARSVFDLDEAEEIGLLATRAQLSWYGSPFVELVELYVRQARFPEALEMMRQVHPYRLRRPPHVQDSDRSEARRALSELFLVLGRGGDAVRVASRAAIAPDRRGQNSRDPRQDLALAMLLDRAARRLRGHELRQDAASGSWFERAWAAAQAGWLDTQAWLSGRQAARLLGSEGLLIGTFQLGRARSAVTPSWLLGDLVDVLGASVVIQAIAVARRDDPRVRAPGYYDALEAEARVVAGDAARGVELASRALAGLPAGEALLRARTHLTRARASAALGDPARAAEDLEQVLQIDPGLIVRMGFALPIEVRSAPGLAELADALSSSPRFEEGEGFELRVEGDPQSARVCLDYVAANTRAEEGCAAVSRDVDETATDFVRRAAREAHRALFAPRVDLSEADATGLDGSNVVTRRPGDSLDLGTLPD